MKKFVLIGVLLGLTASGCSQLDSFRKPPPLTPIGGSSAEKAMRSPVVLVSDAPITDASLWNGGRGSLLGDTRAMREGDIVTVVIAIDDRAEMSNGTSRERTSSENSSFPNLMGLPQWLDGRFRNGATMANAVDISSQSSMDGAGAIKRREKLELRIAATVTGVMPNGVLVIEGLQEVRVNFELRELVVAGYVQPSDISRQNEIAYDKIASARISYGGRGHITDVQQNRRGTQLIDFLAAF